MAQLRLVADDADDTVSVCSLSARVLASRLRRGQLTAADVLEAHLERIATLNGDLNAVVSLDAAGARAAALSADAALRRGEPRGPLHGVPITLKDGHDVAGLRTTIGSSLFDRMASEDGTIAARLRAAGAIIIGHTNVPPALADYQSANPLFGRTCNPWSFERTAGGSSGGAAAAVAAGMTPFEVGSDLAGSLRLPAHFCGVYGLKTTEHRIPDAGFFRPQPGQARPVRIMASFGPLARDLDDLEFALGLLAGPDGWDADIPAVPLPPRRRLSVKGLRLAIAPTVPGLTVARSLRARVVAVAASAWDAGAVAKEALPDVDWPSAGALFAELVDALTTVLAPDATPRTLAWYLDALTRRDRILGACELFFQDFDALILPAAIRSAFPHCDPGTALVVEGTTVPYWDIAGCLAFANLTGLPALAVPAGVDDDGLPAAIQIVGPRWSEMRLLDIARALEREAILPGFRPPPLR